MPDFYAWPCLMPPTVDASCLHHQAPASGLRCSDAWLAFLRLPLPAVTFKRVLLRLHTTVLPVLPNPLLVADFLTRSLQRGGMAGMLALNGIFVLVTQHGLEYPDFYTCLYNLLEVRPPACFA